MDLLVDRVRHYLSALLVGVFLGVLGLFAYSASKRANDTIGLPLVVATLFHVSGVIAEVANGAINYGVSRGK